MLRVTSCGRQSQHGWHNRDGDSIDINKDSSAAQCHGTLRLRTTDAVTLTNLSLSLMLIDLVIALATTAAAVAQSESVVLILAGGAARSQLGRSRSATLLRRL
mgnify:CR=1 FL=1